MHIDQNDDVKLEKSEEIEKKKRHGLIPSRKRGGLWMDDAAAAHRFHN